MEKLSVTDLMSLEQYHRQRDAFRAEALVHKRRRQAAIGPNVTLFFEDRVTVQYQVQEMLRIERIFETEAIEEELAAYNPLIPDGGNLKATMMIEYPNPEERHKALRALAGIEDTVYLTVGGQPRIMAIADEDLERSNEEKTSAVHFLRFEVPSDARSALAGGASLTLGIDHQQYRHELLAGDDLRAALVSDLG